MNTYGEISALPGPGSGAEPSFFLQTRSKKEGQGTDPRKLDPSVFGTLVNFL